MAERHSLLRRQLARHLGPESEWSGELRAFIQDIDQAYRESDSDRGMIERSMELSSQELLQANAEMRVLHDAFPDIFFCLDASGVILHCSAGQQTGVYSSPGKLLGKRIQDIPLPEVSRQFEQALEDLNRTATTVCMEYAIPMNAATSYYEARLQPMPGKQIGVFIRDISARKRVENQLLLTQFAIEHIGQAAYWMTPDARFFYVNGTATEQLGYTRAELLTMSVFDLDPSFSAPEEWPRHWEEFRRRKSLTLETVHRTKAGKIIPVEISVNFVVFEGKEYNCAFARDISARKIMEQTARRSEKMSAVGQLAAGVAHEINNPLTVILGFAQSLIRRLKPEDPQRAPLESIEREARRCRSLTHSLLKFARDKQPGMTAVDPLAVLNEALLLVEVQAKVGMVRLVREFPSEIARMRLNSDQIQQVLINLCSNAIDAMPDGGTLTVSASARGGQLEIGVTDTGTGIPTDIREKIFEPFFTTKPVGKGTGLGLSLTYEIVRGHQGKIELASEPGEGTQFKILLPIVQSDGA